MARRQRSEALRVYLARQVLAQPDGTYVVRAFWPARAVYEISATTKDRLIAFDMAYIRYGAIVAMAYFAVICFTSYGQPWIDPWGFAGLIAIASVVGYGGRQIILHGAKRVSGDLWVAPVVKDPLGPHSRRYYLVITVGFSLLAAVATCNAWLAWRTPSAGNLPVAVLSSVLFATGAVAAYRFRRKMSS